MICEKCGRTIDDDSTYCPYCGQEVIKKESIDAFFEDRGNYWKDGTKLYTQNESVGILWIILAFVIPLGGVAMYFIFKNDRPKTARYCLTAALISWAINLMYLNTVGV